MFTCDLHVGKIMEEFHRLGSDLSFLNYILKSLLLFLMQSNLIIFFHLPPDPPRSL